MLTTRHAVLNLRQDKLHSDKTKQAFSKDSNLDSRAQATLTQTSLPMVPISKYTIRQTIPIHKTFPAWHTSQSTPGDRLHQHIKLSLALFTEYTRATDYTNLSPKPLLQSLTALYSSIPPGRGCNFALLIIAE